MQGFPDLLSIMDEIRARLIAASEEEVANGKDQWVEDEGKEEPPIEQHFNLSNFISSE